MKNGRAARRETGWDVSVSAGFTSGRQRAPHLSVTRTTFDTTAQRGSLPLWPIATSMTPVVGKLVEEKDGPL